MSDHGSDSSSESFDPLNLKNEEGWEDVEPDYEPQNVICFFCSEAFDNISSMLQHCKEKNNFDLVKTRKELELDFIESVKLVNYLRSEARDGRVHSSVSSKSAFEDDVYMKPVLEDDPVLYNLDDLEEPEETNGQDSKPASKEVEELREQLEQLQGQFAAYRDEVRKSLESRLVEDDSTIQQKKGKSVGKSVDQSDVPADYEAKEHEYFDSYSYNSIHEIMLKDTVRTDSYRDFIYENKQLFKDKVVLDVGCGTGILSMFCAKAGAKMVISVDNSNIIEKAKKNVADNGLDHIITCIRGKIEEVTLPVPQVDIIVSEWMGYCLFYEAMFDSVIWARDRYLVPDGLMVPSHTSLRIAPLSDPELIASNIEFWQDVYGFKMTTMIDEANNDVLPTSVTPSDLANCASSFLELDLHTTKVEDLSFIKPFTVTINGDHDGLDGWVIWFDIFFMSARGMTLQPGTTAGDAIKKGIVAFTTGPNDKQTHWQQGALLVDRKKRSESKPLKTGQVFSGHVRYSKTHVKLRALEIEVDWASEHGGVVDHHGSQSWILG